MSQKVAFKEEVLIMAAVNLSPITGVIDESHVIIDFGKHEGKSIQWVAEADPEFYERLINEKEKGIFAIRRQKDKTFRLYINPLSNIDH